jgi:flagellar biosynthesis GTPase FlhF
MGNALNTRNILIPAQSYDPMAATRNALSIRGAEADITRKGHVGEAVRLNNILRQQGIDDAPFEKEKDLVDYFQKIRPMLRFETYPAIKQNLIEKGMNPAILPDFDDPKEFDAYMVETDKELSKFLAAETRKQAGFELEQKRKTTAATEKIAQEERAATAKIQREERAAKAKLEQTARFEQAKLDRLNAKTGPEAEQRRVKWAEGFVEKMARETGNDEFSAMLASAIAGKPLDTSQAARGREALAPEIQPLYDQAIKILSEAYGVPTSEEFTYTREAGIQPIQ